MRKGSEALFIRSAMFIECLLAARDTLTTGRTKELTPEVRENFITFAKSLGLTR